MKKIPCAFCRPDGSIITRLDQITNPFCLPTWAREEWEVRRMMRTETSPLHPIAAAMIRAEHWRRQEAIRKINGAAAPKIHVGKWNTPHKRGHRNYAL